MTAAANKTATAQTAAPPSPKLDARLHAYRPDLADIRLKDLIGAAEYRAGQAYICRHSHRALHKQPNAAAMQISELLFGETVRLFDLKDGWAWVQSDHDGYVGYVAAESLRALAEDAPATTHKVIARQSHVYPAADLKTPPRMALSFGSPLVIDDWNEAKKFAHIADLGWAPAQHVAPIGDRVTDLAATAMDFLGAPYLWGGRSAWGLDCSALLQWALYRAGRACPRDTDMQQAALAGDIGRERGLLRRNDIVFFPGHVGVMLDGENLIHANATHMAVTADPLETVVKIVAHEHPHAPLTSVKRLEWP